MKSTWLLLLLVIIGKCEAQTKDIPYDLTCEYRQNPIGIDRKLPRLSWNISTAKRNWKQTAYQVLIASDTNSLLKNTGDLSDNGKIISAENIHVRYSGIALKSFMNCWWKVRVWDASGKPSLWSKPAYWKMGVLSAADWKAEWIASDIKLKDYQKVLRALPDFDMEPETDIWKRADSIRKYINVGDSAPAVYLRKDIVFSKRIKQATAYVCGLGLHELSINGKRVGDEYLNPAYSDYAKEVLYNAYDVTRYLNGKKNAIGVILGNGWYNLIVPHVLRFYSADYIDPPKLLMQLYVEYTDGTTAVIASDHTWKYTTQGPIVYNDLLSGENYDARKEMPGWDEYGYEDSSWRYALPAAGPQGILRCQDLYPVRKLKSFPAVAIEKKDSAYRIDFGKDLCGWVKIKLHGSRGQRIKINYEGAGSHTLGRYQADYFTLKGTGEEVFQPRFSYNGFRYVDVEGTGYAPSLSDVEGILVATDLKKAGDFVCSNEKFNQLQQILINTIRNYIVHIPNDPTREKSGWTQDIQNGFDVNAYNFDVAGMYIKWQNDLNDIIFKNGYVPPVVPGRFAGPTINGPWWGGMIVYNVIKLDEYYHDEDILRSSYPSMKKYIGYLCSISKNNIVEWGLGDWMEPYGNVGGRPTTTPVPLTSTIAYYYFVEKMASFAKRLNKLQDAMYWSSLANRIKKSYNDRFFNAATGQYAQGSQAGQLMSLHFGLVPAGKQNLVVEKLKEYIAKHDGHLSTGFVASPILLTTLSDFGLSKEAFGMAVKEDFPGWLDMIFNKGNSVMKENWEGGLVQMPSLGGPLGHWFYYSLAGIRSVPEKQGFKEILIRPDLTNNLSWVSASYQSVQGMIVSKWKRDNNTYQLHVELPANTSAAVYLPSGDPDRISEGDKMLNKHGDIRIRSVKANETIVSVGSGAYDFTVRL